MKNMSQSNTTRCANYALCEGEKNPKTGTDYCMTCGSWNKAGGFGWDKLTIVDCVEGYDDECAVCMNVCEKKLMFPTNCGHSFCINCSNNILFWDESRYYLSPVAYGCPPCPNKCNNPEKGKQCACEEYNIIKDTWGLSNPEKFDRWIEAETKSITKSSNESTYGKAVCPLCRKKY